MILIPCLFRLYESNVSERIVPNFLFYNNIITNKIDIIQEWYKLKSESSKSLVFNYLSYPFLINEMDKYKIIQHEHRIRMNTQVNMSYHIVEHA